MYKINESHSLIPGQADSLVSFREKSTKIIEEKKTKTVIGRKLD